MNVKELEKNEQLIDKQPKLKVIVDLQLQLIGRGTNTGLFECPFCKSKAFFVIYPQPLRDSPNNRKIECRCKNGCFTNSIRP